jgi:type II secretory pathway pseudopilin PulG
MKVFPRKTPKLRLARPKIGRKQVGSLSMPTPCQVVEDEKGLSLVEELVALAIVAIGLILLLGAIYTGSIGVRTANDQSVGESMARSQLELIADSAYSPDPTVAPYPMVSPPAGYTVGVTVEYWTALNGPFTSSVRNDGLQRIIVTVSGANGLIFQLEGYKTDR